MDRQFDIVLRRENGGKNIYEFWNMKRRNGRV